MPKCIFCSGGIDEGTGKVTILKTGKMLWFCSSKCESSHGMGRDARKFKWTTKE